MSPAKCGLKSWISVPMFSFTTATRGTWSSSSWGFREDSSEASYRKKVKLNHQEKKTLLATTLIFRNISTLSPLCTKITPAVVQPWLRRHSSPTGSLLWWPCRLQTKQEAVINNSPDGFYLLMQIYFKYCAKSHRLCIQTSKGKVNM